MNQSEPLADRQLPGERAGRRARRASSGPASRGSTATRCSAPCSSRKGRATCRAASGASRSRTRSRPSSAISRTRRSGVTRLTDADGAVVEIFDFCPRFERSGRMYRPVAFVRIVRPIVGAPRIRVALNPAPTGARRTPSGPAAPTISAICSSRSRCASPPTRRSSICSRAAASGSRSRCISSSVPTSPSSATSTQVLATMLHQTVGPLARMGARPRHPARMAAAVIRAAIALKLCQHEETGAIVAALTTSIPEAPNSGRNWDYRYCWIRDAYYTVQALNRLGALDVLENYLGYLRNIVDQSEAATSSRSTRCRARRGSRKRRRGAAGYRGMGPVRVGNAAYTRSSTTPTARSSCPTPRPSSTSACCARRPRRISTRWRRSASWPGSGTISPTRGCGNSHPHRRPHLQLGDELGGLRPAGQHRRPSWACPTRENLWRERAAAIRKAIEDKAWRRTSRGFAATFGGDELDASLLQLLDMRFLDARTIPASSTPSRRSRRAAPRPHMLRYASEDDFGLPETAFNFCTFWFIEALHLVGRHDEARELYVKMLNRLTPAGLLSEDSDFETGELWGNYPQTYSLVGLINCAVCSVQALELRPMSRLIVISNRVNAPKARSGGRAGRPVGRAGGGAARISRPLVRLVGQMDRGVHRPYRPAAAGRRHHRDRSTSKSRTSRNIITATPTARCGRSSTTASTCRI